MSKAKERFLKNAKRELVNKKPIPLYEKAWEKSLKIRNAVYVIWENKNPCYVGETCNLIERAGDLHRIDNHTFRNKISKLFPHKKGKALTDFMAKKYKISYLPVSYGRKELEEYLILGWVKKYKLLNKPIKRATATYMEYLK